MTLRHIFVPLLSAFSLLFSVMGIAKADTAQNMQKLAYHGDRLFIVDADGTLWKTSPLFGEEKLESAITATAVGENVLSVIADANLFIIDRNNTLWDWGNPETGKGTLLSGRFASLSIPEKRPVKIMDGIISAAVNERVVLALHRDGSVWAWGHADATRGDNLPGTFNRPRRILDNVNILVHSGDHVLALKKDGSLWTWGNNDCGGLGDGTFMNRYRPAALSAERFRGKRIVNISAHRTESIALTEDGTFWYWGLDMNLRGQCTDMPDNEPQSLMRADEPEEGTSPSATPLPAPENIIALQYANQNAVYLLDDQHILYNWDGQKIASRVAAFAVSNTFHNEDLALLKTDGTVWIKDTGQPDDYLSGPLFLPVTFSGKTRQMSPGSSRIP